MSTSAVLKEAWSAVVEADLPEKIHEIAFKEAVRLIAPPVSGTSAPTQSQAGKPGDSGSRSSGPGGAFTAADSSGQAQGKITITEEELVRRVATGTGVDSELLDALVHIDEGVLRLNLPGIKLGRNNADRTRAIASIFTVVRSFALDEDSTSVELVRDEAQRLKCYDPANFSSQLKVLQGYVIKGSGSNRRIQVKGAGVAEFPNLVSKLSGDS